MIFKKNCWYWLILFHINLAQHTRWFVLCDKVHNYDNNNNSNYSNNNTTTNNNNTRQNCAHLLQLHAVEAEVDSFDDVVEDLILVSVAVHLGGERRGRRRSSGQGTLRDSYEWNDSITSLTNIKTVRLALRDSHTWKQFC